MGLIKDTTALRNLSLRLKDKPNKVDNSRLHAGSPMYFYCKLCEHQSDVKPESYTSSPRKYCKPCQDLKDANPEITDNTILKEAKALG